ncbi:hypothetical protein ZHAS_00009985 [Anopheles sinensis]|uniref:Uncharacterized protein n=1 Tax=Anopheles sinensis TaxID=74873 RepID=A0A084VWA5_ANOSI|nr:hypothetical protein ZHAS_00009985 [Anopheles sinensis]
MIGIKYLNDAHLKGFEKYKVSSISSTTTTTIPHRIREGVMVSRIFIPFSECDKWPRPAIGVEVQFIREERSRPVHDDVPVCEISQKRTS